MLSNSSLPPRGWHVRYFKSVVDFERQRRACGRGGEWSLHHNTCDQCIFVFKVNQWTDKGTLCDASGYRPIEKKSGTDASPTAPLQARRGKNDPVFPLQPCFPIVVVCGYAGRGLLKSCVRKADIA